MKRCLIAMFVDVRYNKLVLTERGIAILYISSLVG